MPDPLVWSVDANGVDDIDETYGYLTDIIVAHSKAEQRSRLRVIALESIEFSVLAVGREAQLAESLIQAGQAQILAVPLWQFGSPLTADVAPGATVLPIADAQVVPYRRSTDNGGFAIVWRDPFTWELFGVSSTSASGVHVSDVAAGAWAAGSYVYPARSARLVARQETPRPTSSVVAGRFRFSVEPV